MKTKSALLVGVILIVFHFSITFGQTDKYLDVSILDEPLQNHHRLAVDELLSSFKQLVPLHEPFDLGGTFDWYMSHPEPGQTFFQYLEAKPLRARRVKNSTIYIQPLGDFSPKQKEVVQLTVEYIHHFFQLPVKFQKALPLSVIPEKSRRINVNTHNEQLHTRYILYDILKAKRPKNSMAYIAFTATDLYPREEWNFVYGQASLTSRVGVWSIYRNGDVEGSPEEFQLYLRRTIKTATHEIGHIFKIRHCVAFQCLMNGSNNRSESDFRPLYLCPLCLQKLQWNIGFDMKKRYKDMADFAQKNGLSKFHSSLQKFIATIEDFE